MTSSYVHIVGRNDAIPEMPLEPALVTKFEPDRFQKFAIKAIEDGDNVLCVACTGSGKTFVGEYQIAHSLRKGGRVFYTTPIKSLSNQKFYDLKKMFPDRVGIMTGDLKYKPDADVVIMTTEILRNLLFKRGTATESLGITAALSLDRLDAVVFDECHYINDRDRGAVWEETMILLNPRRPARAPFCDGGRTPTLRVMAGGLEAASHPSHFHGLPHRPSRPRSLPRG